MDGLLATSLPTIIWETGAIAIGGPADAPGRRVWSIEVLLGHATADGTAAIVTFDRAGGPSYLYTVDAEVGDTLRSVLGLPAGSASSYSARFQSRAP
jgi:hypothetical protein